MASEFVFYISSFSHENRDDSLADLKLSIKEGKDYQVVSQICQLPMNATLVRDSMHRLGDTADRVAVAFLRILEHGEVWIPNVLDLRRSNPQFDSLVQLNGGSIHDSGITPELKKLVLEEYRPYGIRCVKSVTKLRRSISAAPLKLWPWPEK
ncbi:MAG: hypothetical protein IPM97_16115 [Bdellovibrionaceae bacterium]|nr:hypothetical protein [Pseudobdellovibrionaceae bacterium]